MRLAVFARALTPSPTGRGFAAAELIRGLSGMVPRADLHVFSALHPRIEGITHWPSSGSNPFTEAWFMLRGLGRKIARLNPDVFWSATHVMPGGLPSALPKAATLLDVVWRDLPETMSASHRLLCRWHERNLQKVDRVLCISEFTRTRALAHWPGLAPRLAVIPLAPNPRLTLPVDPAAAVLKRFDLEGPFILTVGTLEPRKNLGLLLDALAHLPDLILVHAGPVGWKTSDLLQRMDRMPKVRRVGYVDEDCLAALYGAARAAVFPSLYEGFHLPALDAASLGCPVIASDIPTHREILHDAATYFPLDSATTLAARITEIIGSPEERKRLSDAGKSRAQGFQWKRSAQKLLQILEGLAGRTSQPGMIG